jgi:hypothetical protein
MPTFELDANGSRYHIDAPDQATAMSAAQAYLGGQPGGGTGVALPQEAAGDGADITKSAGIGVAKGAIGLAGLPGDLSELGAQGIDAATRGIGRLFGADLSRPAGARELGQSPFGSAAIQRGIEGYTGKFYEPKTTGGQYAQTIAEFLPAALAGPGGVGRRLLMQAVVPGAASEAAGQLSKDTGIEPYARGAAALAGGLGAAKVGAIADELTAGRKVIAQAPELAAVKDSGSKGFQAIEKLNVEIAPASVDKLRADIMAASNKAGTMDIVAPQTMKMVDRLKGEPSTTLERVQAIRSELSAMRTMPGGEGAKAREAVAAIDNYVKGLTPADVVSGSIADAHKVLAQARGDWAIYKKSEALQEALSKAKLAASSSGSGANIDNALRQQIKSILNSREKRAGFTPDEISAMKDLVSGGNAMRLAGKLAPTGVVSAGLSAGGGMMLGGPVGAVLAPMIGQAAKTLADARTMRKFQVLDANVRARSPLAQSMGVSPASAPQLGPAANPLLARAALLAVAAQHARRHAP